MVAERSEARHGPGAPAHVIVLGHPLRAGRVRPLAQRIADLGDNIESITQLSQRAGDQHRIDRAASRSPVELRAALVEAADETGVDIAVEPAGLRRRAKRLVVLDVDSTLIRDEAIDVLAGGRGGRAGRRRSPSGPWPASSTSPSRCARGSPCWPACRCRRPRRSGPAPLTPGARTFVSTLHGLGYHVGVVERRVYRVHRSVRRRAGAGFRGGQRARDRRRSDDRPGAGADHRPSRQGGGADRFAEQFGVPLSQTVAVGDGANDIDMLERPGWASPSMRSQRCGPRPTPR